MASAKPPPKSILKKSNNPSTTVAIATKEERDRETALYHANIIQQRKDIELEILLSTERLIDFPLSTSSTASNPALSDVELFKALLRPFQPSDYDCLIEERNINEHCGYTLCPRPRVKAGSKGKWRLVGTTGKAKDFKVVPKEELEKWCSEDCAKRAMYVKVQLSERPAWERAASTRQIELLNEEKTDAGRREAQLAEDLRQLSIGETARRSQSAADLALERGDRGAASVNGLVDVMIVEKEVTGAAEAPSLDANDIDEDMSGMHLALEGYTQRFGSQR
jgi:hypothetical protein